MNGKNLEKLISEAIAIEAEDAKEAGTLGYMARALVQATMPHKNPKSAEAWGRRNGNFSMVMQPGYEMDKSNNPRCIGLPYGTKPRLVMAFVSAEAVKRRSKEIVLGKSLSEFMRQLGLTPTGGRWGTIPMLREQMKRLFSSTISFQYEGDSVEVSSGFRIASKLILFWDPKMPKQSALWESTITLTQEFYDEIIERPVPINMRALSALKDSSLALDIYCWLTYRMSYLKNPIEVPWELLAMQFGSDYKDPRDFKKNFLKQLKKVSVVYEMKAEAGDRGLILKPSKPHIAFSKSGG
jgi:hypothetical protein